MSIDTLQAMASDPREFRRRLLIDTDDGPRVLDTVCDPWQRADFEALDNGWRGVVGLPVDESRPVYQRAYLERGRGHSKTNDLAVSSLFPLVASRRLLAGYWAAGDEDQAQLGGEAIERLTRATPVLCKTVTDPQDNRKKPLIDVQRGLVRNTLTGSTLKFLTSDAPSSFGLTPDFIVVDEITHWRARPLWDSLISAAAKRGHCMLTIIANAGMGQGISWQWEVREAFRSNHARNYFSRLDGCVASWITPERMEEQRSHLPAKAYRRLWGNQWTTETGDCLDENDLLAAVQLPGPLGWKKAGYEFVGGWDAGLKRDHAAACVLGLHAETERIELVEMESWAPAMYGGTIPLENIERFVLDNQDKYGVGVWMFDPWQSAYLAERLNNQGVRTLEVPFTAKNLDQMATTLLHVFRNRMISLYDDRALRRDLNRLSIIERTQGFRLHATRDEHGHADRATALALTLPEAVRWLREFAAETKAPPEDEDFNVMFSRVRA